MRQAACLFVLRFDYICLPDSKQELHPLQNINKLSTIIEQTLSYSYERAWYILIRKFPYLKK